VRSQGWRSGDISWQRVAKPPKLTAVRKAQCHVQNAVSQERPKPSWCNWSSAVVLPGFGARGGMKLTEYFLLDRQPYGVECQSLFGSEVP